MAIGSKYESLVKLWYSVISSHMRSLLLVVVVVGGGGGVGVGGGGVGCWFLGWVGGWWRLINQLQPSTTK